jgi:hypothetical protein
LAIRTLYICAPHVGFAGFVLRHRISAAQASKSTGTHNMSLPGIEQPQPGMAGYDVWPSSAADLKRLHRVPRVRLRRFKSISGTAK